MEDEGDDASPRIDSVVPVCNMLTQRKRNVRIVVWCRCRWPLHKIMIATPSTTMSATIADITIMQSRFRIGTKQHWPQVQMPFIVSCRQSVVDTALQRVVSVSGHRYHRSIARLEAATEAVRVWRARKSPTASQSER